MIDKSEEQKKIRIKIERESPGQVAPLVRVLGVVPKHHSCGSMPGKAETQQLDFWFLQASGGKVGGF